MQNYAQIGKSGASGDGGDISVYLVKDALEVLGYSAANVFRKEEMTKKKSSRKKNHSGSNNDDIDNGGSRNA
jgi:hypothetical protein